jgi:peptidoglycan/xylan/chitin deacetylase (PgdA/CDA1 family)
VLPSEKEVECFSLATEKKIPWFCLIANKKKIILLTFDDICKAERWQVMSKVAVYWETR